VRRGVAAAFPRQLQAIITTREVWASHRYPGAARPSRRRRSRPDPHWPRGAEAKPSAGPGRALCWPVHFGM